MTCLPDINLWIALTADRHIHHDSARKWLETAKDSSLIFCRITELGFLRLLTNKHVMGDEVLSSAEAWQTYKRLSSDSRVGFLAEPAEFSRDWDRVAAKLIAGPNAWTDAYLGTFAAAAGLTVVTFDKSFPTVNDCRVEVLPG